MTKHVKPSGNLAKVAMVSVIGAFLLYIAFLIISWVEYSTGLPMGTLYSSFARFPWSFMSLMLCFASVSVGIVCCIIALLNKVKGV
jgi:hypothetical protein